MFITFEGGEGCGKTTQIKKLVAALDAAKLSFLVTREPGGTEIGETIRRILLSGKIKSMEPLTELMLYAADRAQHCREVIAPALKENKIVICDRFTDSTTAYQGYGRGLDWRLINTLNHLATNELEAQLTFLLDCPVAVGLKRSKERLRVELSGEDRFEKEALEFHERVREGFLDLAKRNPERFRVLDGTKTETEIHESILKHLKEKNLIT